MDDAHVDRRRMLAMKPVGERSAGNPHAAFDERGRETGSHAIPAPFLDSTEHVDAAHPLGGRRDHAGNGGAVGNIHRERARLLAEQRGFLPCEVAVPVGQKHARPFPHEDPRSGEANAGGRASDDAAPAGEAPSH